MKIYIAAPLFSPIELEFNEKVARILSQKYEVFLPQKDGILVSKEIRGAPSSQTEILKKTFSQDIIALETSDIVIAVLDGRVPDEGVCVELGYAKALGLKTIGLKTDGRVALPWGHNPMVSGCIDIWLSSLEELSAWVSEKTG